MVKKGGVVDDHRVSVVRCKPPVPVRGGGIGFMGLVYRGTSGFPLHTTVACGTYDQAEQLAEAWVKAQANTGRAER